MLAHRDRVGRDQAVRVVGRGDEHGVDILAHLVEHLAVVPVALGVRVAVESVLGIFPVDVAQGHDIFGLHVLEVGGAMPPIPTAAILSLSLGAV